MGRPRTKQEFEKWYRENPNAWNYKSFYVKKRIAKSVKFIKRNLQNYNAQIIEFGAFNGDVTSRIVKDLENVKILVNDISETALEYAKNKIGCSKRVSYICADMLDFPFSDSFDSFDSFDLKHVNCALILECLYYLAPDERILFLHKLLSNSISEVFVSAPINKENYLKIEDLSAIFIEHGYKLKSKEVVSIDYSNYSNITRIFQKLADNLKTRIIEHKNSNQIIYYFHKNILLDD